MEKIILVAGVGLLFEVLQFLFVIGGTDITDLISNTLGGAVGIGFYIVLSYNSRRLGTSLCSNL